MSRALVFTRYDLNETGTALVPHSSLGANSTVDSIKVGPLIRISVEQVSTQKLPKET